jgi:hypothetical protein
MAPLHISTAVLDDGLTGAIESLANALEQTFPGVIHSAYLFGSHTEGTTRPGSDLDLCLVAEDDPDEVTGALTNLCHRVGAEAGIPPLDVLVLSLDALLSEGHFRIASCSVHLWGLDVRPDMPPLPFDRYLRRYTLAPLAYMGRVLRGTSILDPPLTWPDPDDEWRGYSRDRLPPQGIPIQNVKAFVATACWIASVLVSFRSGRTVASKRDAVSLYRAGIGDAWTGMIEAIHDLGVDGAGYALPESPSDRAVLRDLCTRMPDLENHYLDSYRAWLLTELHCDDTAARVAALERLAEVTWRDATIMGALHRCRDTGDAEVRNAAIAALNARILC